MLEDSRNFFVRFLDDHGNTLKAIFGFTTVLVNFFHLLTLLSKELRSDSVFILMIGIAVCDIFTFLNLFLRFSNLFETLYTNDELLVYYDYSISCVFSKYCLFKWSDIVIWIITNSTRPISVWLAILMALIRALSTTFPMSIWIQNLTKSRKVVVYSLCICVFWFGFYLWNFRELRPLWVPDIVKEIPKCRNVNLTSDYNIYILAKKPNCLVETSVKHYSQGYSTKFEAREPFVRLVPALIYPLVTIPLLWELLRIKMRQKTTQADKITILIFILSISFMLSEGLQGFFSCLVHNCLNLSFDDYLNAYSYFGYSPTTLLESLRFLNALSPCFVCYWLSSQYRTVASRVLFCIKLGAEEENKVENVIVQEAFSSSAQPSRNETLRRNISNSW